MLAHDWPGNVRELKQAVQSAVLFAQGELVTAEELNLDESGKPSDPDIALKGECMEKKRICQALEKAGHNRKEAARLLGISRSTLYEKMDLYGRKQNPQRQRNGKKPPECLCDRCMADPALCPLRIQSGVVKER